MKGTPQRVSRRGLLAAAAAGSAIALTHPADALAAAETTPLTSLTHTDRIGTTPTRLPNGLTVTSSYTVDLHDRLAEWLRFWWANSPGSWRAPLELVGETAADGRAFLLTAVRYTAQGKIVTGFTASTEDKAYWGTLASLHRFFAVVQPGSGVIRLEAGTAGYTGSAEQQALLRALPRHVWGARGSAPQLRGQADWLDYTKAALRAGLGTES